jgi:hypothetical protein
MTESTQRPATKTYEATITVFELLMMDGMSPETYGAIKKHWNNKWLSHRSGRQQKHM